MSNYPTNDLQRVNLICRLAPVVQPFWGISQLQTVLRAARRGEERDYFLGKLEELADRIASMPKTFEQDGLGDDAIAHLHYFHGGSDWYITEKDMGSPGDQTPGVQLQAFGFAILNGDTDNAEFGYISIAELARHGVELDLHWEPKPLREVKRSHGI